MVLGLVLVFALEATFVEGTNYVVGDRQGWGLNVQYARWTARKPFKAGDTLVFNYGVGLHNVVPVNANGYRACKPLGGSRPLTSGKDKVTLRKGPNYFICSITGHCAGGMKIVVNAA